uniref:Uncharacterized protein n=1 Tax=Heterorhabditis bacteriophora TaxID=37862 RepID=A0A1I7WRA5_HETBA
MDANSEDNTSGELKYIESCDLYFYYSQINLPHLLGTVFSYYQFCC